MNTTVRRTRPPTLCTQDANEYHTIIHQGLQNATTSRNITLPHQEEFRNESVVCLQQNGKRPR
ncbi:hypothetical protein ACCAA_1110015 [Candidatus Accumulibacter aalborgensis]|uniref:Uncharacterized protein n=1 Tax=Candidatus Accumulibacter aalborgensis TaxID=1860102 RepID=A0A1A8XH73_9PROT|nr:hypothetical protein ACCAA_1110015 [Candidatus Accumulibacter aalborgensis]